MLDNMLAPSDLAPGAAAVAVVAARSTTASETNRRLGSDVVVAMIDAGFARHFVPATWGGDEGTFEDLVTAVAAIGEACASTAWCASLTASLGRMAAFLPGEGQAEIWADGPDTLIVGALMPLGKAEPADGGWRLSGEWPFVSAIDFSDWALVCGTVTADGRPEARFFAVPRAGYSVRDTWFNVGMRATGSNTLVVDDVFVPAGRSFTRDDLATGRSVGTTANCHAVPLRAVNGLSFAAPVLGAARGALRSWSGYIAEKIRSAPVANGISGGNAGSHEIPLARAAGEIDAAQLLLERAAAVADRGGVTSLETARSSRDCALAVDLLVAAADRLFRAAGTRGQSATNSIQRFWRDVNTASSHVVLQFEPAARSYAAQALSAVADTPAGQFHLTP